MTEPVLQSHLPHAPWLDPVARRLPGVRPLDAADWLVRDDAFAGQMALRDSLIDEREGEVHVLNPSAFEAAQECLDLVLEALSSSEGYTIGPDAITRPDGVAVPLDRDRPLLTIGRLVQEDMCLLLKGRTGEHVLEGAILCFPASWTLAEKMGKPLTAVHAPVPAYAPEIALRVQRLFDAIRPEQPLWRANALLYDDAGLYSPRREAEGKRAVTVQARYLRSERQTMRKLPVSGAVVFAIHTYIVRLADLTPEQRGALSRVVVDRAQ